MESVRQAHAPQDVLELWIGANLIEAQVRKNPGVHRALGVRSFEPLQCPFTSAEALKNDSYVFGRNVPLSRQHQHLLKNAFAFGSSARDA